MSEAVQAALPWIVCGIAAAILIPAIIDIFRRKTRKKAEDEGKEQNTWLVEGVGIGMLAGYWLGRALVNAVLGLALGVLAGRIRRYSRAAGTAAGIYCAMARSQNGAESAAL